VPVWHYPVGQERPKFGQLVIPTLDSVRYEHLMALVHSVGKARCVTTPASGLKCMLFKLRSPDAANGSPTPNVL
jgi:hypothetical protein